MPKLLILLTILLSLTTPASARELAGVNLPEQLTVAGTALRLNGCGLRTKFFIKAYVGSLYTAHPVTSLPEAQRESHSLIRMNFLHSKIDRNNIVEAFSKGLEKNAPATADSNDARRFLGWFNNDFLKGDEVEIEISAGVVSVRHNGRSLGSLTSPVLARDILTIWLGEHPADEELKERLLGK